MSRPVEDDVILLDQASKRRASAPPPPPPANGVKIVTGIAVALVLILALAAWGVVKLFD